MECTLTEQRAASNGQSGLLEEEEHSCRCSVDGRVRLGD